MKVLCNYRKFHTDDGLNGALEGYRMIVYDYHHVIVGLHRESENQVRSILWMWKRFVKFTTGISDMM